MSRADARTSSLRRRPSRTVPAVIVAVLLTAAGVALVWATVIRLTNGRWPGWVGATHEWVAAQTWGSATVITISIAVAVLGLMLLVTALTPGHANAYLLAPADTSDDRATGSRELVMTRRAVAKLATAHAQLVDGVDAVSADVGARTVNLAVRTPSAHRSDIEQAVTDTVTSTLTGAGLSPMPTVNVSARTRR